VYKREANKLFDALRDDFDQVELECVRNEAKPRRNTFEIALVKGGEGEESLPISIWSGIHLKPRKAKFPDHDHIKHELRKHLNFSN